MEFTVRSVCWRESLGALADMVSLSIAPVPHCCSSLCCWFLCMLCGSGEQDWSCVGQENRTGGVNCESPLARSYTLEWKNHRDFCRWVGMVSLNWCGWLGKVVCDNSGYPEFLQDHLKIFRNEQLNHVHSFVFMMAMIYLYSGESNTHTKNLGATFMAKILFLSDQ